MFKRRLKAFFLGITLCISFSNLTADVTVPNIIKLDLDAAKALLKQHHLHIGEISEIVTSGSEGTILKQNPRKNSQVSEDTAIRIILAVAKKTYKKTQVPNVQGLSLEAAKKAIQAANLQVGSIKKIRKSVEEETVLYQTPLVDTPRFENTQVDLVVAEPTPLLVAWVKLNLDKQ
jgi:beta-lactam-binding protein with PASTA domain